MVALLQWVLIGALIGWVTSVLMVRTTEQRALSNLVIGVLGAVLGGMLSWLSSVRGTLGLNGFATAFIGSLALLLVVNLWARLHPR